MPTMAERIAYLRGWEKNGFTYSIPIEDLKFGITITHDNSPQKNPIIIETEDFDPVNDPRIAFVLLEELPDPQVARFGEEWVVSAKGGMNIRYFSPNLCEAIADAWINENGGWKDDVG